MLVALYRQEDFLASKALFEWRSLRSLGFIPLAIVFRSGVNVVSCRIAVDDPYGLTGHGAEPFLHIDKHVGEMAVLDDEILSGVCALAFGVLAHVNLGGLGCDTVEFHSAADAGGRCRINRRRWRGRCGGRRRWFLFCGLLLAASGQENHTGQKR